MGCVLFRLFVGDMILQYLIIIIRICTGSCICWDFEHCECSGYLKNPDMVEGYVKETLMGSDDVI
jgi:hypothetical protein